MNKRKIAALILAAVITNFSSPSLKVLADEISRNITATVEAKSTKATIGKFELLNSSNIDAYDKVFKMNNSNIESITNNGGNYNSSSTIDKAIDGNFNTHWETGNRNSSEFTNEIVFKLKEETTLNRIVYATRQSSAKGKGFAQELEIYGSLTDEEDDFTLVSTGEYTGSTGDIVEIKFNETKFKRVKFVFKKANQDWASASEFMFYKTDEVSDKMDKLFTDATMSKVSEEFNTIEKLETLENEAKKHPLYSNFKEEIENAKLIIENKKVVYTDAKVSKFKDMNSALIPSYNETYKIDSSKIKSITTNGGQYSDNSIDKAIDGNINTKWHSNEKNSTSFTNEVVIELNELTTLNRIVYTAPRGTNRGFAEQFDIYASRTTKGDTFELVSSGSSELTQDSVEIRFNPTEFKRVKFVFKKAYEDWACAAEFGLYTQDELAEKIERLFTDSTMSIVSEEFNSVDKLNVLEEEVKNHPFYEDFKEDIANARELVNQQKIEASVATTKQFEHYSNEEYSNLFRMDNENIEGIKNNGNHYLGQVITNAIDGNLDTYWETNKYNTNDFTNEVEIEFKETVELNRVVYGARKSDNKGFAKEFEIYGSTTSKGDTYQLVATGNHNKVSGLVEAKFNPTKFKRIKFKFKNSDQNWATLSEIAFYKQDKVSDKVDSLFTNALMNELSEEFNSIDKLQALENEVKGHPLESSFEESFELAHKILNGELETVKVITAEQHGDMVAHANKNLKFGFGNNNQPTGISAKPGDEITVYVDADPSQPMPKLAFSQQEGSFANWMRTVDLKAGKNVITVPDIAIDNWYNHEVTRGGSIYIINPYTSEQQSKAPVIRFASGDKYPFLTEDTNVDEFKEFLIEYKKAIDEDIAKNPNVSDREVLDVFEFVSDHLVWTGTATGAYEAYIEQGANPLDTINRYNNHMEELFRYYGLDGSNEQNDPKYIRENVRLAQPFGYMYAYTNHIGVQRDVMAGLLIREPGWGLDHEIGHRMDVNARLYGEVTNNMLPMYMSAYYNKTDNRIPFENRIYKKVISENSNKYTEGELAEQLGVYWQLEMYKPGYWGELNKLYRERNVNLGNENPNNVKMQYLVKFSSEVVGEDLSEYFARHGFEVNEETRQETSQYPKPDKKIWYLNNSKFNYNGNGFTKDTNLEVSLNGVDNGIKLTFNIDNNVKSDLLGYEVLKDGEVIGFTSTSSFVDTNADKTKNSKYEVIPYDINLGTGEAVVIESFSPRINAQQNKITLKLNEDFNPLDYVKILSYEGEDISSKVEIEQNVDTKRKGIYQVKYTVSDEGISVSKILEVEVVSNYDYLSDYEWTSAETVWGNPRRNSNIKGRVNGLVKDFEKGFGIHANGTITYNLSGKDYDNFEALLGVDAGIGAQNNSSIKFEIIGDGKVLETTEVLKHDDNMVYINVPVKGVKQLVIKVSDAGNGNNSDHSVIANPRLTTNNAKPVISVDDKVYKLGEVVDFMSGIEATDAEDGNLISKVEIISNNYEEDKTGRFEVVYKVTDMDNNSVEKKAYVTVYEDFIVTKSKFGEFDNLDKYNEEFKIGISSVSNNAGSYPGTIIGNAIDEKVNTHWETNKPNSNTFKNEVIFDLGESKEINRVAYKARNGGKGFAKKFEIYVSTEAEGNDFILAGKGEYSGNVNDVVEFEISKTTARRVMFKFIEANQDWASIGEVAFYGEDRLADKIKNDLFTDSTKTEVTENYNTLDEVQALREEVKNHPAAKLFEEDLAKAEEIIRAKFPTLNIEEITYVKLRDEFDLMSGVTANDKEDGNITKNVKINSDNFNINKTGEYTITYTVTDSDNNVAIKERKVVVYSSTEYLSDIDWQSARTDYETVRKDKSSSNNTIKLLVNGETKEFEKGIGTHANSEIVYNLENSNYDYFETYIGVDRNIKEQNNSSIIFKVLADGEEVYNSGIMKYNTEAKLIRIPVKGVNKLELIVNNAGNGISSDHGSFGEAKFLITNSKPKLTIPKSISTKVGQEIDLKEEFIAIDAEDGDITKNVKVTGKVNFNKTGKYPITYKVTDSDGNEVVKTRTIAVVDMNDYSYLTDYDWKSTQNSYATPKKDISISNNSLRLTDEDDNEVSFERGIGAHATSTIVYDLADKDYSYFSSYVGVDRQMFGSVGSVIFQVYVDGEKKFDSGLMNSRDSMKYLEVDINGAKELKLVVTDGGNGIGSDHATWGNTKLHFAKDVQVNYEGLLSLIEEAKKYEKDKYTEESFKILENALNKANIILEDKISIQEEVNSIIEEINNAIDNLEEAVDLNEVINISDKYLKAAIKQELNLSRDNITIGDMYKLVNVSFSNKGIESIEALKYARNLESIDLSYNEIKDLSPLKNLKKLTNVNANPQIITEGMLYAKDNKITLDYKVLNRNGEELAVKEIIIRKNTSTEAISLPLDELVDENGVISFDISKLDKAFHSIYLVYEDQKDNFLTQSLYMFEVK